MLAESIRHVKACCGSNAVPACDHWDHHEKRPFVGGPAWTRGHDLGGRSWTTVTIVSLMAFFVSAIRPEPSDIDGDVHFEPICLRRA